MKRVFIASLTCLLCATSFGGPRIYLSISRSLSEAYRPGWPPALPVTLADWGLRGPVKQIVSTETGKWESDTTRETLQFDTKGRLVLYANTAYGITSEERYFYKDNRLLETVLTYNTGEVKHSKHEYDRHGYLTRIVETNTTDIERMRSFQESLLAKGHTDSAKMNEVIGRAKSAPPGIRELIYQYGPKGMIKSASCLLKSSTTQCTTEYTEYSFDTHRRLIRQFTPKMQNPFATRISLDPNVPASTAYSSSEQLLDYPSSGAVVTTHILGGKPISTAEMKTNHHGDIETERGVGSNEDNRTDYLYTYDDHQNWIRRTQANADDESPRVREISYW